MTKGKWIILQKRRFTAINHVIKVNINNGTILNFVLPDRLQ